MIRTDLAQENIPKNAEKLDGITKSEKEKNGCKITSVEIHSDKAGEKIGKPKGRYITVNFNGISPESFEDTAECIADELSALMPKGSALVACLGNKNITPDAIGPMSAEKILATRHIADELPELEEFSGIREVSVLAMGVLGQTGIEAAEIVKSVCERTNPDFVIVVDALACRDSERLCRTVQLSTSGISPGSGVQNSRKELSEKTLGVPVIAVGIPTVIDMHTVAEKLTGREVKDDTPNMMVTPRDIDKLVERSSKLIGFAVDRALFPEFSFEELEMLCS